MKILSGKLEGIAVVKFKCMKRIVYWHKGIFATELSDGMDLLESLALLSIKDQTYKSQSAPTWYLKLNKYIYAIIFFKKLTYPPSEGQVI